MICEVQVNILLAGHLDGLHVPLIKNWPTLDFPDAGMFA